MSKLLKHFKCKANRPIYLGLALGICILMIGAFQSISKPKDDVNLNGGGCGRLSPASLDLDTYGCPTTFGDPACEIRTSWTLEKTTDGDFTDPDVEPFMFTLTVTEGPTTNVLTGEGQIVLTNSGEQTTNLSNVAILLEKSNPGQGDAPGPSGKNWTIVEAATESEFIACGKTAPTAYDNANSLITQTDGSNLVLTDPDTNDTIALSGQVLIPPTVDDDGDGQIDEDPVNGIDDDGDGLFDEDSACENAVIINFRYEFDIADDELSEGDTLRIDLIATFNAGGFRGGANEVDIDCDGTIEEEEEYVRSIQQRHGFEMPSCNQVCDCVNLVDDGATPILPCVTVDSTTTLNEDICANQEGTITTRYITGTVTCADGCSTTITNRAELTCDDSTLITGSPASASFDVTCGGGGGGGGTPGTGDFCSQTQGGWGNSCNGNNPGCLRDTYFDSVFPSGLIVGDPDGPDGDGVYAILLSSAAAVEAYLPAGGTSAALTADQTDPQVTSSGVFGGQLVAATLNVGFDAAGIGKCTLTNSCDFPNQMGTLGDLIYGDCVVDGLQELNVNQVIALANTAISGGGLPVGVSFSNLNDALSKLNEEFDNCSTVASGCLTLPEF